MTDLVATDFTQLQIDLIKRTIAKNATDDELRLFLYRAKNMGLDPLKPGQIYFVKYGNSPGSVVVGLDGFRSIAAKTGKHVGTKRGEIRDEKNKLIGAWAEVYRADWQQPAREEVTLEEYRGATPIWQKMPGTMIKKVAECAALRMAFSTELGGVYAPEEMDQAQASVSTHASNQSVTPKSFPQSLPRDELQQKQSVLDDYLEEGLPEIAAPVCCGRPMMKDKFTPNAFYCMKCKSKINKEISNELRP